MRSVLWEFFLICTVCFAAASITEEDVESELHVAMRSLIVVTAIMKQRFLTFSVLNLLSSFQIGGGR
jgi:hypothetical protein